MNPAPFETRLHRVSALAWLLALLTTLTAIRLVKELTR